MIRKEYEKIDQIKYLDELTERKYYEGVKGFFSERVQYLFDVFVYAPNHIFLKRKNLEARII